MLPFVKSLKSIDTYRDGGSMSISFISLTGIEHTLLFPVSHSNSHNSNSRTYAEPILEIYRKVKRVSHVTGLASYDTCIQKKQLKWQKQRTSRQCHLTSGSNRSLRSLGLAKASPLTKR